MFDVLKLTHTHPIYSRIIIAMLISGIGSTLTQVCVFSALAELKAPPFYFALAFALSTLPALFSTHISTQLARIWTSRSILGAAQIVGAVSVAIPVFGLYIKSSLVLLFAEFFSAFVVSISFPHIQLLIKDSFKDTQVPVAAKADTWIFTINVVIGTILGSLLLSFLGYLAYLIFDFISFGLAAYLIYSTHWQPRICIEQTIGPNFSLKSLTPMQSRAFWVMPLLTLVGTTPVALLPSLGENLGPNIEVFGISLASSMFLLIAKSAGQFIGPMMLPEANFEKYSQNNSLLFGLLLAFFGLYLVITSISNALWMFGLVVLAHIFSNIVYLLGFYLLQHHFNASEILDASATQYRLQMIIITVQAILAGILASQIGTTVTILILSGGWLIVLGWILKSFSKSEVSLNPIQCSAEIL